MKILVGTKKARPKEAGNPHKFYTQTYAHAHAHAHAHIHAFKHTSIHVYFININ